VTFDQEFDEVMRKCAEPRPGKTPLTWITPRIMEAYWALHRAGYAHSIEVWDADGRLAGGLYGVAIGDVFVGESQFAKINHASKVGMAYLHCHLAHWGYALRDAKFMTAHLASLGFRGIPRATFQEMLRTHAWSPRPAGSWAVDAELDVAGWKHDSPLKLQRLIEEAELALADSRQRMAS
jgi:leucyl/phenylalanyl-tRNA--protein transferase